MIEVDFAVVKSLKLGPIKLYNVPIAFADVTPFDVLGMQGQPSLLLGTDLMENFRRVSQNGSAGTAAEQAAGDGGPEGIRLH